LISQTERRVRAEEALSGVAKDSGTVGVTGEPDIEQAIRQSRQAGNAGQKVFLAMASESGVVIQSVKMPVAGRGEAPDTPVAHGQAVPRMHDAAVEALVNVGRDRQRVIDDNMNFLNTKRAKSLASEQAEWLIRTESHLPSAFVAELYEQIAKVQLLDFRKKDADAKKIAKEQAEYYLKKARHAIDR
jgi:hypothetical protein